MADRIRRRMANRAASRPAAGARAGLALLALLAATLGIRLAFAQSPLERPIDPGAMNAPGPGPGGPGLDPGGKVPRTHAAPGGESEANLPTQAPSLPEDPLAIPPTVEERIGSDAPDESFELGRAQQTTRQWYGPWYDEQSGDYRFRTLFPLWFERSQPDDEASFYFPLYFPLYRSIGYHTTRG